MANKLYFIKHKDYEMAELHLNNLMDKLDNLEYDSIFDENFKYNKEEFDKIQKEYINKIEKLQEAFNNCYFQGYTAKAEWCYVEVIKNASMEKQLILGLHGNL